MADHDTHDHTGIPGVGGSTDLDAIITASSGQDIADALAGATAPDAGNVFATIADITGGGMTITDRQGGSASDWSTPGSTNRSVSGTPTVQAGSSASVTVGSTLTVTFPVAFTNPPVVVISVEGLTVDGTGMNAQIGSITTTNFVIHLGGVSTATGSVRWIAIGI